MVPRRLFIQHREGNRFKEREASLVCTCVGPEGALVALDGLVDKLVALQFVLAVEAGIALVALERLLSCRRNRGLVRRSGLTR